MQRVNLSKTDLDSKGRAFETFMGSHFRGDFGQFFTPRAIVKFIVDTLPITNDDLVLDTSCGSGGFLLYALDKVREKANELFPKYKTNADERQEHWNYWHGFAQNNLYGIELNDDIARTAKMNMIIHDDGHTNVIAADGLLSDEELREKSGNKNFRYETFDYIITNPPFGSSIKQTEKAYLGLYELGLKEVDWLDIKTAVTEKKKTRDSQSTEVLFLEQCHRFLTEGGYIAIVIPDGILSNSSLQIVRDKIEELYRIVAVVSLPQTAFTANGAGVKSSVLFLRKHKEKNSNKISAQKLKLKEQLKTENKFVQTIEKWQKETNEAVKKLEEATKQKNPKASKKEIAEAIKDDKAKLQNSLTDKINNLKDEMSEKYFAAKQQILDDYQIFMAIAEDIGYDATGRNTGNNELIEIGNQLSKFITYINKTEK
ncbi:N-6 DNA Methylase [anaerobic digester metagenome]